LSVPLAAFTFAHGGPRIDTPPPALGQHSDEILAELGELRSEIRQSSAAIGAD
jgi:crotonobetainyl-CoA:carnitine CoA-transferase CaiB-like acyl-CoA transferase